jgi:hypothetical protein
MPAGRVVAVTVYQVTATREGRWWLLRVPELDVVTQVERLSRAEETARDAIATWLDVPPAEVTVELVVPGLTDEVAQVRELQRRASEAQARASDAAAGLARDLHDRGLSVREAAAVLGVSFQRVQQLLAKNVVSGLANVAVKAADVQAPAEVARPARKVHKRDPARTGSRSG